MLSPGKWHERVKTDPTENRRYRRRLIKRCRTDKPFRKEVMIACKNDIFFWINSFVWQFNPDHVGHEVGPFILWDYQKEAIREVLQAVIDRRDVRWQKSREMGASWVILMVIDWLCLFHDNKDALVMSRDEKNVDYTDNKNSLFAKIDFIHEHLPSWMTRGIKRVKLSISFKRTRSVIMGESSTEKTGVGGLATIALIDEFGQFDANKGVEVYSRTRDTCHARIFVFTHKDTSSMAYALCFDQKYQSMREIITHWSQHPEKKKGLYRYDDQSNRVVVLDKQHEFPADYSFVMDGRPTGGPFPGIRSPWYDFECTCRPARAVAMDLDIDPRGASDQFFDSQVIKSLKNSYTRPPLWVGDLVYDSVTGEPHKLAPDPHGLLKLWIHPKPDGTAPYMTCGAGADIAQGVGASPTCLSMASARTGEKFLEYANAYLKPENAATYFTALCRFFRNADGEGAKLVWEMQGHGQAFGQKVIELGYMNVWWKEDEDIVGVKRTKLIPGWNASPKSILTLMTQYREALSLKKYLNPSWDALDETLNFVFTTTGVEYRAKNKGKLQEEAASGARIHHGDMVVADALSWKMIKDMGFDQPKQEEEEMPSVFSVLGRRKWNENLSRRADRQWA